MLRRIFNAFYEFYCLITIRKSDSRSLTRLRHQQGTDHGWGGHKIITGGAVKGGKAYGNWPQLTFNSEDDYSNGRVIPSISTDQVNASLCEWFGLNTEQIHTLFPNLANFQSPTLDFMNNKS
ncbi:DUF1501 domain-containing protein [Psychromonas aquimarina]|uniref:DUF1501 domain-containing protein n=1 Tax=Psychromonas aquimarina TaxID=444919 RepID=UPI000A006283|nr:DUF1501 domain-containing protein [Psychromonas aquimarina]